MPNIIRKIKIPRRDGREWPAWLAVIGVLALIGSSSQTARATALGVTMSEHVDGAKKQLKVRDIPKAKPLWSNQKFSRDNLHKSLPDVPSAQKGFAGEIGDEFLQITKAVTGSGRKHKALNDIHNRNPMPSERAYREKLMVGQFDQSYGGQAKPNELYQVVYKEYTNTLSDKAWSHMTYWHRLSSGMDFSFDFGAKKVQAAAKRPKVVRYGLVLKDIKPDDVNRTMTASLSDTSIDQWEGAAPARPVWTIAPVEDHGEIELRKVSVPVYVDKNSNIATTSDEIYADAMIEQVSIHDSRSNETMVFWKIVEKLPDPKFKGKIKPRAMPGTSAMPSKMPGMELTLSQSQGFYSATLITKENMAREGIVHTFQAPIWGTVSTSRVYDEHFKVKKYTVSNVLIYKHLPSVSVTKYVMADDPNKIVADSYKTSLSYSKELHSVVFSATTPPDYDFSNDFWKKAGEIYKVDYQFRF